MKRYIAADFGAGSGRVIVGTVSADGLQLDEIHRFPNRQIRLGDTLYWDFPALFEELKTGLKKAFSKYDEIVSIGVDTWGGFRIDRPEWSSGIQSCLLPGCPYIRHFGEGV